MREVSVALDVRGPSEPSIWSSIVMVVRSISAWLDEHIVLHSVSYPSKMVYCIAADVKVERQLNREGDVEVVLVVASRGRQWTAT